MRTPLSIYNLLDGGWRTLLSVTGIGIAILLIFMQLGFLGAVRDTAIVVYDQLEFDLVVRSRDYYYLCDGGRFPRERLGVVAVEEEIVSVEPFHVSLGQWSYPKEEVQRAILILGASRNGKAFRNAATRDAASELRTDRTTLIDQKSTKAFLGQQNQASFGPMHIGEPFELNGNQCEISGLVEIGAGLAADGTVVLNERGFARIMPGYTVNDVTLGLIKIADGVDAVAMRRKLEQRLKAAGALDVEVVTREELIRQEVTHWLSGTPAGFIFMAGVAVALVVGSIIIYIVLSSDVTRQLGEYATLKAMGYKNFDLSRVVFEQAFLLALCGYLGATLVAFLLYAVVGELANLPIEMTSLRLAMVFIAALVMSCGSGALAMQKLRRADPADLF